MRTIFLEAIAKQEQTLEKTSKGGMTVEPQKIWGFAEFTVNIFVELGTMYKNYADW